MQFSWLNKDHNSEKGKVAEVDSQSRKQLSKQTTILAKNKPTGRNVLVDGASDQSQSESFTLEWG